MECVWKNTSACLKIFKAIQHTNPMINVSFNEHGIRVMSMDQSKTSLVKLQLAPSTFANYSCTTPMTLGLYTETLTNILQKAKKATLLWKAKDQISLSIYFVQDDQKTEFSVRAIDIEEDELDIPELVDDVAISVHYNVLRDWMDKLLMAKSDIHFKISQTQICCSANSTEFGTITHTEPINGERVTGTGFVKPVEIALSHHATKSMFAFSSCGADICFMGFSNEMPSRLKVDLGENSFLCLYVAPKIVDEY
jgi:proliferating cell nuclear antigen PCNA